MNLDFPGPAFAVSMGLLVLAVIALVSVVAARILPVLASRYDGQTMQVEPLDGAPTTEPRSLTPAQQASMIQLQRWCWAGAGPGHVPFWQPWHRPHVEQLLSVAWMCADLPPLAQRSLVERFSRQLDGSDELGRAGGAWAGLWFRLRVKRNDSLWWRERQTSDPWDCGYLVNSPATHEALPRFHPRRATLLVAAGDWTADALRHQIEALCARREQFHHPVRVLVMEPGIPVGQEPHAAAKPASNPVWSDLPCEMSLIRSLDG